MTAKCKNDLGNVCDRVIKTEEYVFRQVLFVDNQKTPKNQMVLCVTNNNLILT